MKDAAPDFKELTALWRKSASQQTIEMQCRVIKYNDRLRTKCLGTKKEQVTGPA